MIEARWKQVVCPTCGAKPGESCGREKFGVPWMWERTAPHVARKRAALTTISDKEVGSGERQ